jgi:hypothetical protein
MRKFMIAAVLATAATPALAQIDVSQGLVDVTIQDVSILNNFLNDAQIAALNGVSVPVTVQVPVGVAANVCPDLNANVLAAQKKTGGGASCTATSGSKALAQQVVKQKLGGQRR